MPDVLRQDGFWDRSRVNGTSHESLTKLKDAFVQVNDSLPKLFLQVNAALFKVEEKQLGNMLINLRRFHFIAMVDNIFQRLKQFAMCVESGKTRRDIISFWITISR